MKTSTPSRTNSAASTAAEVKSGPFARSIIREAKAIADQYRLIVRPNDNGRFKANVLELPLVFAHGATASESLEKCQEMARFALSCMLEAGERPPAPMGENKRSEQVNIRLSLEEKLRFEEAARQQGFRGVSDFIRAATLAAIRTA